MGSDEYNQEVMKQEEERRLRQQEKKKPMTWGQLWDFLKYGLTDHKRRT